MKTSSGKPVILLLEDNDRVVGLEEKPAEPPSHWICPPFYFLMREALNQAGDFLNQPAPPDAMGYLIHYLVDRVPIYAYKARGGRLDIGSIEGYHQCNRACWHEPGRIFGSFTQGNRILPLVILNAA